MTGAPSSDLTYPPFDPKSAAHRSVGTRLHSTSASLLLAMLAGQGCTTASVCGPIGDLDRAPLATLRCQAGAGSKRAAFVLGQRYEAGRGVAASRKQALSFYRQAARDTPSRPYIYTPGQRNRVVALRTGMGEPGLPEAKQAVQRLEGAATKFLPQPE